MQKIMKNWIFTLVMGILLLLLSVLMLLDGFGVADRYLTVEIIHEITAVFVACYVLLVLCPMIPRYQKKARFFALGEIALLILVVVGIFFNSVSEIRWIENMVLCSVVGLVIWLRSAVELIRSYLEAVDGEEEKAPLWRVCVCVLTAAIGVWQMASPVIGNRYLIFPIAVLTLLIAAGFGVQTVRNRKAMRACIVTEAEADAVAEIEDQVAAAENGEAEQPPQAADETSAEEPQATEESNSAQAEA
jgi:hypothetical protein